VKVECSPAGTGYRLQRRSVVEFWLE